MLCVVYCIFYLSRESLNCIIALYYCIIYCILTVRPFIVVNRKYLVCCLLYVVRCVLCIVYFIHRVYNCIVLLCVFPIVF